MAELNEAKWYVVHTYSGYENKVKTILEKTVEKRGMQDIIQEINVPTEDVFEIKDGKKKAVKRKKYPGYEAVNFDRWKICKCAEVLGRREHIRLYQFLKEPLIERYGQQWYDTLVANCELYIKEYLS